MKEPEAGRNESGAGCPTAACTEEFYQFYGSRHQESDEEVRDEDEIKSQTELTETKVAISIADVKGNDEEHGKDIADLKAKW